METNEHIYLIGCNDKTTDKLQRSGTTPRSFVGKSTHYSPCSGQLFAGKYNSNGCDKKTSLQHNNNKEWSVTNWQIIKMLQIMLRGPSASSLQLTPWQKAPGVDEGRRLPYALLYPLTCSRLFVTPGLCVPDYLVTSCPAGQAENVTKTYIAARL